MADHGPAAERWRSVLGRHPGVALWSQRSGAPEDRDQERGGGCGGATEALNSRLGAAGDLATVVLPPMVGCRPSARRSPCSAPDAPWPFRPALLLSASRKPHARIDARAGHPRL